jgi:hypothetical protein
MNRTQWILVSCNHVLLPLIYRLLHPNRRECGVSGWALHLARDHVSLHTATTRTQLRPILTPNGQWSCLITHDALGRLWLTKPSSLTWNQNLTDETKFERETKDYKLDSQIWVTWTSPAAMLARMVWNARFDARSMLGWSWRRSCDGGGVDRFRSKVDDDVVPEPDISYFCWVVLHTDEIRAAELMATMELCRRCWDRLVGTEHW